MRIIDWSSDVCSSDRGPRYPRQWDKLLLKAGMVVALLIPLCYLAWYFLTPAPQRGPNVQQLVDAQLRNYACSELSGIVDAEGAVTVSGFVSKPGEIEQVRRDVAAIAGVESGAYAIKVRIWPHCGQIGRAHVCTPVTNAHLVCR